MRRREPRAESMSSSGGMISKTKEGVPQWSGEASSFTEYEEQCLLYEQSVEYHKRYMVGPRLISELQGPARRLVVGKKADWVSFPGGVQVLLNALRASLGKPQVSEMADYLTKYFRQTRRKAQESMADYITRKCEVYLRAQQALRRVLPQHQKGSSTGSVTGNSGLGTYHWSRRTSVESTETGPQAATPVAEATGETTPEAEGESNQGGGQNQRGDWQWNQWSAWNGGWYGYQSGWNYDWWSHGRSYGSYPKPEEEEAVVEILPDFVQGWYLLFDASLNTTERNLIHTAVQGDYSLQRIAQELRSQWDDNNIRQRDSRHQTSYMGEAEDELYEEDYEFQEGFNAEHLSEEGQALVAEAEEEAQTALAALHQAKRTLREAREKQHQVRMSRQYFKTGPNRASAAGASSTSTRTSSWNSGRPKDDSKMVCLKCSKIGHRAANCPQREQQAQHTDEQMESAPFICYGEMALSANHLEHATDEMMTTQEAMKKGWCVVDGGATRTLGSLVAVQNVIDRNAAETGDPKILKVDTERRPIFSFGNSSENQCMSTIELGVQAGAKEGKLTVHTLDTGSGPILLSVASLRSLGAIVDFSSDLMVFKNLDPRRVIQARRSQSGHQLLPLCGDMFKHSFQATRPILSLKDYLP